MVVISSIEEYVEYITSHTTDLAIFKEDFLLLLFESGLLNDTNGNLHLIARTTVENSKDTIFISNLFRSFTKDIFPNIWETLYDALLDNEYIILEDIFIINNLIEYITKFTDINPVNIKLNCQQLQNYIKVNQL